MAVGTISIPFVRPDTSPINLVGEQGPSGNDNQLVSVFQTDGGVSWVGFLDPSTDEVTSLEFVCTYEMEEHWGYLYVQAWTNNGTVGPFAVPTNLSTAADPNSVNPGEGITGRSNGWVTVTCSSIPAGTDYIEILLDNFGFATYQGVQIDSIELNGVNDDFGSGFPADWLTFGGWEFMDITSSAVIPLNDFIFTQAGTASPSSVRLAFPEDTVWRSRWRISYTGIRGGTTASGTTSATVNAPTGLASGDLEYLFVESSDSTTADGTPNTPSGFTKLFEETQGSGVSGVTTLTIFARLNTGTIGSVTVDGVLDHVFVRRVAYPNHGVSNVATDIIVGTGNGADTGNATALGITTTDTNFQVLVVIASTRDAASTATFSAFSNINLQGLTERGDNTISTGAGGGIGFADGRKASAGSTGNTTATIAVSDKWRAVMLAHPAELASADTFRQQYRVGAGSWIDIDDTTPIQVAPAVGFTDGDITDVITSLSPTLPILQGEADDDDGLAVLPGISGGTGEIEFAVMFDSTQVDNGDAYSLRCINGDGSMVSAEFFTLVQALGVSGDGGGDWTWGRWMGFDIDHTNANLTQGGGSGGGFTGTYDGKLWFFMDKPADFDGDLSPWQVVSFDPLTNKWEKVADHAQTMYSGQKAVLDGKLYFTNWEDEAGTEHGLDIYDIVGDSWSTGANPPTIIDAAGSGTNLLRNEGVSIGVNGLLYVLGGDSRHTGTPAIRQVPEVHIYDPNTDTWDTGASHTFTGNSFNFAFCNAAAIGSKIYVTGQKLENSPASALAVYDTVADTWTNIPVSVTNNTWEWDGAPTPMWNPSDDSLWLVVHDPWAGGIDLKGERLGVAIYHPGSDTWETSADDVLTVMRLAQWFSWVQEGWNRDFTTITRPTFDGGEDRSIANFEFSVSVDRRACATIDNLMCWTDGQYHVRWRTAEAAEEEYGWGIHLT